MPMARSRYRSQPHLQRSGDWIRPGTLGMSLAVGIGLIAILSRIPSQAPRSIEPPSPIYNQAASIQEPSPITRSDEPPVLAQSALAAPADRPALKSKVVRLTAARKPARPMRPPSYPLQMATHPAAPSPEVQRERERQTYERAVQAYEARERADGYAWGRENRIGSKRYCRATRSRTAAFMEGCLDYIRLAKFQSADTPDLQRAHAPTVVQSVTGNARDISALEKDSH
jgi:hypothetical protein